MIFRLDTSNGQPLYLQVVEQVRHAVETGVLQMGDQMPGIRALAEELVVSHNTVAKAYSELEHVGVIELRPGVGAFITGTPPKDLLEARWLESKREMQDVVRRMHTREFSADEVRRLFESQLMEIYKAATISTGTAGEK